MIHHTELIATFTQIMDLSLPLRKVALASACCGTRRIEQRRNFLLERSQATDSARAKVLIDITGSTSRFPMSLLDFNMNKCSQCLINRIIGLTIKTKYFTICYWTVLSSVLSVSGLTSTLICFLFFSFIERRRKRTLRWGWQRRELTGLSAIGLALALCQLLELRS